VPTLQNKKLTEVVGNAHYGVNKLIAYSLQLTAYNLQLKA